MRRISSSELAIFRLWASCNALLNYCSIVKDMMVNNISRQGSDSTALARPAWYGTTISADQIVDLLAVSFLNANKLDASLMVESFLSWNFSGIKLG